MENFLVIIYKEFWSLIGVFISQEPSQILFILKIISGVIYLFVMCLLSYLSKGIYANFKRFYKIVNQSIEFAKTGLPKGSLSQKWHDIEERLNTKEEGNYRLAVIEADNMLDDLLKKIGYEGDDMGERLKQLKEAEVPSLNELWQAHKLRNKIVHEPDVSLTYDETKKSLEAYKRAFEFLEVI